jgi:hypothetical protein
MAMTKFVAIASVGPHETRLTFESDTIGYLTDDARDRIQSVLNREAQRVSEIAYVNTKDQVEAKAEAERLKHVPADRPHIVAAAGTKDPVAGVQTFWRNADGSLRDSSVAEHQAFTQEGGQ